MVTIIEPVKIKGAQKRILPRNDGFQDTITIDNDDFDDDHDFIIEKRDIEKLLIDIINTGDTYSLSYEIFSSIDPATSPPAFSETAWHLLNNGSGDISKEHNEYFNSTMHLIWVMIRLKRQTAGQTTTAKILSTSGALA